MTLVAIASTIVYGLVIGRRSIDFPDPNDFDQKSFSDFESKMDLLYTLQRAVYPFYFLQVISLFFGTFIAVASFARGKGYAIKALLRLITFGSLGAVLGEGMTMIANFVSTSTDISLDLAETMIEVGRAGGSISFVTAVILTILSAVAVSSKIVRRNDSRTVGTLWGVMACLFIIAMWNMILYFITIDLDNQDTIRNLQYVFYDALILLIGLLYTTIPFLSSRAQLQSSASSVAIVGQVQGAGFSGAGFAAPMEVHVNNMEEGLKWAEQAGNRPIVIKINQSNGNSA